MDDQLYMNPSKHHSWTDVAVFEDLNAARLVESLLSNQGIHARINDDKFFRRFLFLRPPRVTFRTQVDSKEYDRAKLFLRANAVDALNAAIHCPDCGSMRISYPQMTRKFVMPTLLLHLGILLHVIHHQCYCEDCHCFWDLENKSSNVPLKAVRQST